MPRAGVDAGHATGAQIPWHWFIRFDLAATYRYTDYWADVSLSIDGGAQTWTAWPISDIVLSQSSTSALDVSSISVGNVAAPGVTPPWNVRAFTGSDQWNEMPVKIWLVQFDPAVYPNTLTIKGQPLVFEGRIGGGDQTADGWLKIPLNPHAASWNAVSLFLIDSHCPYDYKGPECGYAGGLATCARTREDCLAHANQARFGGSDFMPATDVELSWGTLVASLPVVPVDNTSVLKYLDPWEPPATVVGSRETGGSGGKKGKF